MSNCVIGRNERQEIKWRDVSFSLLFLLVYCVTEGAFDFSVFQLLVIRAVPIRVYSTSLRWSRRTWSVDGFRVYEARPGVKRLRGRIESRRRALLCQRRESPGNKIWKINSTPRARRARDKSEVPRGENAVTRRVGARGRKSELNGGVSSARRNLPGTRRSVGRKIPLLWNQG